METRVSETKQPQGWEAPRLACNVFLPEVDGSPVKADVRHLHYQKEAKCQGWHCNYSLVVMLVQTSPDYRSTAQTPTGEGYVSALYAVHTMTKSSPSDAFLRMYPAVKWHMTVNEKGIP